MEIKMLENECWYGGVIHKGMRMPFDQNSDYTIDMLKESFLDQVSPLFISNKGRYIHSDKPFRIHFDRGVIKIDQIADIELSDGFETLKGAHLAAAKKFFKLDGRLPNETFLKAPQYNTWIELQYNQTQEGILKYAHSLIDEGMPAGVLMIDEGWAPDYGDFDFCKRKFENPKAMVDELHSLGFKVMLWVTPHISPDGYAYRELATTNYLIKDKDGKVAIREWWNGWSCVLDLTNPKACEWFKKRLDSLIDKYGVDGFKFDAGNQYMYADDDKTYLKKPIAEHTKAFDMFASQYEFNELRCIYDCGGMPIVARLQDKIPQWEGRDGMPCLLPSMLMQGLMGYYFGCPDMVGGGAVGAFEDGSFNFDEELYLRWLEESILCPMVQFSISPKRLLSEDGMNAVIKLIALRESFKDKILTLAKEASVTGEPIIRMLEYEFPNEGFERVTDMFMLGCDILVAPVAEKGKMGRYVKLPKGNWKSFNGRVLVGGDAIWAEVPVSELLWFEKL